MATPKNEDKVPQHWFLVCGEVVFRTDKEGQPFTAHVNCIMYTRNGKLPVVVLNRIQQQLAQQFHMETNNAGYDIGKLTVLSIMPMGLMTKEEFNAQPKGMASVPKNIEDALAEAGLKPTN
jgi:hypothetical protein